MEKLGTVIDYVKRITLPQAIALLAGVGLLFLLGDRVTFPSDLDGWKQVVDGVIYLLAALATVGAVAHGKAPAASAATPSSSADRTTPVAVLFLAVAIAIPNQGCGASALSAHARASSVLTVALEGADHLADVGGETAMAACSSIECTHDVENAVEAIDAGVATVAIPIAAYVQAVEMALAGGEDLDVLSALGAVLLRALAAWDELVPLYRPLGVELPQLPRSIHALVELVAAVAGGSS